MKLNSGQGCESDEHIQLPSWPPVQPVQPYPCTLPFISASSKQAFNEVLAFNPQSHLHTDAAAAAVHAHHPRPPTHPCPSVRPPSCKQPIPHHHCHCRGRWEDGVRAHPPRKRQSWFRCWDARAADRRWVGEGREREPWSLSLGGRCWADVQDGGFVGFVGGGGRVNARETC